MEIIKKIVYVLLGIISNVIIPITILHKSNFEGILGNIALILIILVVIVFQTAIFFLFEKMVDEGKYTGKIFPMFCGCLHDRERRLTTRNSAGSTFTYFVLPIKYSSTSKASFIVSRLVRCHLNIQTYPTR